MRILFIVICCALVGASLVVHWMNPNVQSSVPIIYWVTDNNPARALQIKTFRDWLKKNNYQDIDLRIDTANGDMTKTIIQGVSGVAGDAIDCGTSGGNLVYLVETGIVEDVTEDGLKMGFDPSKTYESIRDDITVNGRQYVFPCNVYAALYFVNKGTFEKYGLKPPPMRWNFEEFEKFGREFVEVANKGQQRRTIFLCPDVPQINVARSLGEDIFNETLTAATVDRPGFVKAFELCYKWTYVDHLTPSAAEVASFSSQSGYGGLTFQLFNSGNYGMISTGRYALIQFRQFGKMQLDAVEYPNGGYPNTTIGSRAAFVYKGGKHKDLAKYFLAYLASEDYNMNIVEDADSLPPNPIYTLREEYLRPKAYPNEWGVHEKFAKDAVDISIVLSKTPFGSNSRVYTHLWNSSSALMSQIYTPLETAKIAAERINEEITRNLDENPKLRAAYDEACGRQKKIDELKAAGKKIPLSLVSNPFHQKYYKDTGRAE